MVECVRLARRGVCAALLLVAVGTGGIKPCVSAFGGDQYGPHQAAQQATFFSIFYFSINVGSMMSTIVTPIVKVDAPHHPTQMTNAADAPRAVWPN